MKRRKTTSGRRPPSRPAANLSIKSRLRRALSPPQQASWAKLLEAVNEPELVHPAAKFGAQDDEMGRFKMAVYEQVIRLLDGGKRSHIAAFNRIEGKYPLGVLSENPFHWTLFAMSKSDQVTRKIHPAQVRQLGLQLNYAYKHRIPPELLVGFLHQTGATGKRKQDWISKDPDAREWWLESYVSRLAGSTSISAGGGS